MIKALQKKFIVAAMIAITVLLLVLLGMINTVNAWSTEQQSDRMLTMLLDNEISLAPQWPRTRGRTGDFGSARERRSGNVRRLLLCSNKQFRRGYQDGRQQDCVRDGSRC
ncbi:MAG: hypothetical protein ACLR23_09795 [Clostridia bacterium]